MPQNENRKCLNASIVSMPFSLCLNASIVPVIII